MKMSNFKFGFTANQIIEQNRTTIDDVSCIRTWLNTENLPKLTDEQIVLFLLSCCNNRELTRTTITRNYELKQSCPQIFTNRRLTDESISKSLTVFCGCELPERFNGCTIIVSQIIDTNYRNYDFAAYLKLSAMCLDALVYEDPPEGVIIIMDAKGFSFMHLAKIKIHLAKFYMRYVQEGIPLKLHAIHFLNCSYVIQTGFRMIRPFIKMEVMKTIHFHMSDDIEMFYENHIPKRYLPKDYGGDLGFVSEYRDTSVGALKSFEKYFEYEETQRLNVS